MKVKIICGTYGYRPDKEAPRVVRKNSSSPPFELDAEEAQRIISLGVAEACNETGSFDGLQGNTDKINIADQIMRMEYADMQKLAKKWGVSAKGSKEELRERLMQVNEHEGFNDNETRSQNMNDAIRQNADDDQNSQSAEGNADQNSEDEQDDDEPPVLNPQEPV